MHCVYSSSVSWGLLLLLYIFLRFLQTLRWLGIQYLFVVEFRFEIIHVLSCSNESSSSSSSSSLFVVFSVHLYLYSVHFHRIVCVVSLIYRNVCLLVLWDRYLPITFLCILLLQYILKLIPCSKLSFRGPKLGPHHLVWSVFFDVFL